MTGRGLRAGLLGALAWLPLLGCGAPATEGPAARVVPLPRRAATPVGTAPAGPTAWVEVAADPEARERGLMGRRELAEDEGMLFVYPDSRERGFWMKDCFVPLSAAFLDDGARVLRIADMEPGAGRDEADLPIHRSGAPARYVLEMRRGWFRDRGIGPGTRLDLSAALEGRVVR